MEQVRYLQDWVESQMIRGRYIFTKEDVLKIGLPISNQAINNSLGRLAKHGVIMSPWQNFYVIIPTEYKLRGIVPPSFYIDRLMSFLGRKYYVALLSAAEQACAPSALPLKYFQPGLKSNTMRPEF